MHVIAFVARDCESLAPGSGSLSGLLSHPLKQSNSGPLHGENSPIGQSQSSEERIGEALPANPALPDTLPRKRQHGPIAGCTASSLTRCTSNTSAALCPTVLLDYS
ncbi:hypothetical protein Q8A73_004570 [Channa argus]|nr:hypothetical protein Q8A73_004570 [Channa argus]